MTSISHRVDAFRSRVPTIFAGVLTGTAILSAVASVRVGFGARTQPVRTLIDQLFVPAPANLAYAVFLIILATGVNHRKRVGYRLLLALFLVEAAADALLVGDRFTTRMLPMRWDEPSHWPEWVLPHLTIGNLVITGLLIAVLLFARGEFTAKTQQASLRQAAATFGTLLAVSWLTGWLLVEVFPGSLRTTADRMIWTLERILGGTLSFDLTRQGRAPGWVNLVLGLFGAISLLVSMWVLLRSQRSRAVLAPAEESRLRELLDAHGESDSLGYFATRRDKRVIFSPSGKAAVTYRVVAGVTLASGDPIGDPEAWGPAIAAWLAQAREYAWTPAVMGASEAGATAYARAGLRVFELGDEAILHPDQFTTEGPDMQQVRQAVARVERAGYTVRIRRHAEITRTEMIRIIGLAARWRDTETERGFSMALGRLGDPADGRCVLVEAVDRDGKEAALLSFVPWGHSGLSLDLMRRDRTSDNGLIETMVVTLLRQASELGVDRVSLNFAMFRAVFEEGARIGAGPILVAWRKLLLFLSRWFQLESLYRSNVKYRPQWLPRFLCFEDVRDLAKVGLASGIAEGFLVAPSLPTLLSRGGSPVGTSTVGGSPIGTSTVGGGGPEPAPAPTPARGQPPEPELASSRSATRSSSRSSSRSAGRSATPSPAERVDALRSAGIDPYPAHVTRDHSCAQVHARFPELPSDTGTGTVVSVAGRLVQHRGHGRLAFARIRDASGDLQIMLSVDRLGQECLRAWRDTVRIGDLIAVTGEVVTSKRGELSVHVDRWKMVAACLHQVPQPHPGLPAAATSLGPEYQERLTRLLADPEVPRRLRTRSAAIHAIRSSLIDRGFIETEPTLGGTTAATALETLIVAGTEQAFSLAALAAPPSDTVEQRATTAEHPAEPAATILEVYQAYADPATLLELVNSLVAAVAVSMFGPDHPADLPWPVVPVSEAISKTLGEPVTADPDPGVLQRYAAEARPPIRPGDTATITVELYQRLVQPATTDPVYYVDFPATNRPEWAGRPNQPDRPECAGRGRFSGRWELVAAGSVIAEGRPVVNDPTRRRGNGQPEPASTEALVLEFAMPPTAGLTLNVDGLLALLTPSPASTAESATLVPATER